MRLQVTLDTYSVEEGIERVRPFAHLIDIVEVGTPLLLDEGMESVDRVHESFPTLDVLADTKIWHNGERIAQSAFVRGATMVSILAGASDREVETVVRVAESFGGTVVADLAEANNAVRRAAELEDLGVRCIMVPSGLHAIIPRSVNHVFQHSTRAMGGTPLALARNVSRGLSGIAEVAVVDNINLENLDRVMAINPGILLVGRAILSAEDSVAAATEFRQRMTS